MKKRSTKRNTILNKIRISTDLNHIASLFPVHVLEKFGDMKIAKPNPDHKNRRTKDTQITKIAERKKCNHENRRTKEMQTSRDLQSASTKREGHTMQRRTHTTRNGKRFDLPAQRYSKPRNRFSHNSVGQGDQHFLSKSNRANPSLNNRSMNGHNRTSAKANT